MSVLTDCGYIVKIHNEDCEFVGEDLVIKTNIEVVTQDDEMTDSEEEFEDGNLVDDNENIVEPLIKSELPSNDNFVVKTEKVDGNYFNQEENVESVNPEFNPDFFDAFSAPFVLPNNFEDVANSNFLHLLPRTPVEVDSLNSNNAQNEKPKRKKAPRRSLAKETQRDEEGYYLCNHCEYKAKQLGHLGAHIDSKHTGIEYNCDLCDFKTRWKNRLNSHKRSIHKEEGGYYCPHCNYLACEKYVLSQHMKQVHPDTNNPSEKSYSCQFCSYKAHQKSHVTAHVEAIHQQITYVCDLCGFQTKWRNRLRTHTNSKHRGFTINCDHCDFKTSEKFLLKQHVAKKHGNIQFTCFLCDVKVPSRKELNMHMENVHQVKLL